MILDSYIEQQIKFFERLKMSEAHGVMQLQMFDHITGKETERIEHNMITNLYKDYIESMLSMWSSVFTTSLQMSQISSIVPHNLCGGILLFDTPQTESVNNYAPVAGNCIGYAGGQYAGVNTFRGNYKPPPISGQLGNTWTRVWEFETDKANGNIASVCLCPVNGGNQGYNNVIANVDTSSGAMSTFGNFAYSNLTAFIKFLKVSDDLKTLYYQSGTASNGTLYLRKMITPDPSSILYLGSAQMKADTASPPSLNIPSGQWCWLEFVGNTLYGLWYNSNTKAITLKTYDLNLNELSSISLNNSSNVSLYTSPNSNYGIIGNILYALDNSNHTILHKWNITTGNYISSIQIPTGLSAYSLNTFDDSNIIFSDNSNLSNLCLYNGNTFMGPWFESYYVYNVRRIPNKPIIFGTQSNNGYIFSALLGQSFFTINNLSTPVEKKNSNSMKITYKITFTM